MEEKKTILDVKHLRVDFTTDQGTVQAVRDVSFSVKEGEILGIVGESGSGKSVTMYSVMGLLAQNGSINEGEIVFDGESIARKDFPDNRSYEKKMREIRGNTMAMIFQESTNSLNSILPFPSYRKYNGHFVRLYEEDAFTIFSGSKSASIKIQSSDGGIMTLAIALPSRPSVSSILPLPCLTRRLICEVSDRSKYLYPICAPFSILAI